VTELQLKAHSQCVGRIGLKKKKTVFRLNLVNKIKFGGNSWGHFPARNVKLENVAKYQVICLKLLQKQFLPDF